MHAQAAVKLALEDDGDLDCKELEAQLRQSVVSLYEGQLLIPSRKLVLGTKPEEELDIASLAKRSKVRPKTADTRGVHLKIDAGLWEHADHYFEVCIR